MGFWSWVLGETAAGETANATVSTPDSVGPGYDPGDEHGVVYETPGTTYSRSLPVVSPSPWSGWPSSWGMPNWQSGITALVDTAWDCIDLNAGIISAMPVYRLKNDRIVDSIGWMKNPDDTIYTSWEEFAKQLFWDYQMGEAFVLGSEFYDFGAMRLPSRMKVIPAWAFKVEMDAGRRRYWIGTVEVTDDVLHIRYKSSVDQAHGIGPLDAAGARLTTAGVLQRQIEDVAKNGGVPPYILEVQRRLGKAEADELLDQWMDSRARSTGSPAITSGGTSAKPMQQPSAKDMALLELAQFTESRICIKLGVPPFLMGLPSGGDSMTYSNVSSLFDYHDRSSLKTKATHVMKALSWWALPPGESAELNRDEYTRPSLLDRANAYQVLNSFGALSAEEARSMERLHGDVAASALTGGNAGE